MKHDWKPGDIAVRARNTNPEGRNDVIGNHYMRVPADGLCGHEEAAHWHGETGGWGKSEYDCDYDPVITWPRKPEPDVPDAPDLPF